VAPLTLKDQRFSRRSVKKSREIMTSSMQTEIAAPRGQSRGCAKEALHHVGDHRAGSATDEERRENISERGERKQRLPRRAGRDRKLAGWTRRNVCAYPGAEVMRGLDKRARYVLEGPA